MKLHQLRALVAVADHGSINGAAKVLFVSQPAITKAIRELEADIGVELLGRTNNGVTLTASGRSLLGRARLIVSELARAEEQMAQDRGAQEGRIAVGLMPLAALTVLPPAYAQFRLEAPKVQVEFLEHPTARLLDNLRKGTLDFALASPSEPFLDASIRCVDLLSFPAAFAVRRDGELAKATRIVDLADAEWLHVDTTEIYPAYIADLFRQHGLPPPRMTRCTSQALLYNLAVTFDAVVSAWSAHALGAINIAGQFVTLDFVRSHPPLKLQLLQREGAILTRASEQFIRCIMEVVQRAQSSPNMLRGSPR